MHHTRVTLALARALVVLMMMSCVQSQCNITAPQRDCITLFNIFRKVLVNPSRHNNLFRLQLVYYPPSRRTPTLIKVTYNLNITCSPGFGKNCTCTQAKNNYTLGWTNRELYKIFHPAVINLLRFQLPFWVLQISESKLTENLDVDSFLWDGTTTLPSTHVFLDVILYPENFTSGSCPPNGTMIRKALGELNHWVSC